MFNNYLTIDEAMRAIEIIATTYRKQREHIESLERRIEKLEEAEVSRSQREKGKRGEREVAKILRDHGYDSARRGVQYSGGPDSPDVVGVDGFHIEVKRTEQCRPYDYLKQSESDASEGEVPIVVHRQNDKPWIVIMDFEDFLNLIDTREKA